MTHPKKTHLHEVHQVPVVATPMDMIAQAVNGGADVEVIAKLMTLQERWQANQARLAFEAAMADARAQLKPVIKTARVSYGEGNRATSYQYETLGDIEDMLGPIYAPLGLNWRWESDQDGLLLKMTCIISHRDGHQTRTTLQGPNDTSGSKNAMQSVGSSATYLQRYTLKLAAGLAAAKDDDAQAATPGNEAVSEAQLATLTKLIKATKTDLTTFQEAMAIETITDMPVAKFERAESLLLRKQAKIKEAQ